MTYEMSQEEILVNLIDRALNRQLFWTGTLLAAGIGIIELKPQIPKEFSVFTVPIICLSFSLFLIIMYGGNQISKYLEDIARWEYTLNDKYDWTVDKRDFSWIANLMIKQDEKGNWKRDDRILWAFYIATSIFAVALLISH